MAGDGQAVDDLIGRIRRVLHEDVVILLKNAADPQALATQIRAHLTTLLAEAEAVLGTLRGEAERWHETGARARQTAAVETQLAVIAAEQAQSTAIVAAARNRAEQQRSTAAHAEAEEHRVRGWIDALHTVINSLRAMLARLGGDAGETSDAPAGHNHMSRAAALAAEIDALNENALRKVREMRTRADSLSED